MLKLITLLLRARRIIAFLLVVRGAYKAVKAERPTR
jgi:hypothetical protein